jgi:hypothetical protein
LNPKAEIQVGFAISYRLTQPMSPQ